MWPIADQSIPYEGIGWFSRGCHCGDSAVWFLCAATENVNGSHTGQLTRQLGGDQNVRTGPNVGEKYVLMFDKGVCEGSEKSPIIKKAIKPTSCVNYYQQTRWKRIIL